MSINYFQIYKFEPIVTHTHTSAVHASKQTQYHALRSLMKNERPWTVLQPITLNKMTADVWLWPYSLTLICCCHFLSKLKSLAFLAHVIRSSKIYLSKKISRKAHVSIFSKFVGGKYFEIFEREFLWPLSKAYEDIFLLITFMLWIPSSLQMVNAWR